MNNAPISNPDKLRMIAAYWNSNITKGVDRGFSICLDSDLPKLAAEITRAVTLFDKQSAAERDEFLSVVVYAQLREASRLMWSTAKGSDWQFHPDRLSRHNQTMVMVYGLFNIALLQAQGLLVSDEYNGMLYVYRPEVATAIIPASTLNAPLRGRNPRQGYREGRREMRLLELLRESRHATTPDEARAVAAALYAGTIIVQGTDDPQETLILLMEETLKVHHCHGLDAAKGVLASVVAKYPERKVVFLEEDDSPDHTPVDQLTKLFKPNK